MSENRNELCARLLADCTAAQREAITYTSGPLLVLAGAGSGKTRVITRRISYLLATGVAPQEILAITFTNKAADEMRQRVAALCGPKLRGEQVWLSTFHSMCARLLRAHAECLGRSPAFSIYDDADTIQAIRQALKDCDLTAETWAPAKVARAVSEAKAQLLGADEYAAAASTYFQMGVARVYRRYSTILHANNAMDFDDLLLQVALLLRHVPYVCERYQERFRHILIDEYQDTNHAQYVIAKTLAARHRNICVTGDPDQSIYGWRGADIGNILAFERDYPDAKVVRLEQNYRSTKVILRAASALICHNFQRKHKELWTENPEGVLLRFLACEDEQDEARTVTRDIAARVRQGMSFGNIAVFYRTNAQSRSLETALREFDIPYAIVAGTSFFARREIRDLVAYLRVMVNPHDEVALERVLNVPPRGLGGRSVGRLRAWAQGRGCTLHEALLHAAETGLRGTQAAAAQELGVLLEEIRSGAGGLATTCLQALIDRLNYVAYVQKHLSDAEDRLNNVRELVSAAAEYDRANPEGGVAGFLERIALVSDQDAYDGTRQAVSLMTLHAAKGLEFSLCYITGLEEGLLPLARQGEGEGNLEEERRLCFVGLTRAQHEVVLTCAAQRSRAGRREYTTPSRFLAEMGREVMEISSLRPLPEELSREPPSHAPQQGMRIVYDKEGRLQMASLADDHNPKRIHAGSDVQPEAPFDSGDWVVHPTFGRGQVLGLTGWGERRIALVRFNQVGLKRIALRVGVLKKVLR